MNSILEIYNFKYTPPEDYPSFYSRFKALVIKNLKRKGHRIGGLELLQDEILTPTFEDIVLLWCLEKVDSSFPGKIRKNFGEQINSGTPLKELEIEIFKYLSEHYASSIESDRHIDDILSTVNEDFVIKHETNITFNKLEIETIKQELLECQTKNNNAIDKDIPIEDIAKIECDEEVFADNVDQNSEDYLSDALNDDLSDIDIENGKIEHSSIKEEDSENLKLLQNKASAIKQNSAQTCDICNKKLSSKRRLREHLESVHKKTFTCKLCQEVFSSRKDLILHRTEEHKRKWKAPIPVSCDLCGKSCNGKRRLREHLLTKHSKKSCKLCDETFNGIELLRQHKQEVHKKKWVKPERVICDTCGRSCAGQRRLKEHIKNRHNKEKLYACKNCDEIFETNDDLKTHKVQDHKPTKKPAEMCPHCGKLIRSRLKRHILTHISNIGCHLCSEKFISQEDLDAHLKKHEENPEYRRRKERTIHCNTCKRTFVDENDFRSHVCKHFSCETCDMKFLMKRNLEMHKRIHAGETLFSCDLCESLFVTRKSLYCHKRASHDPDMRKHKCDECQKAFLNPSQLERHKLTHSGVKPFKCTSCDKAFRQKAALDTHMNSHTGYRPFPCLGCDARFFGLLEMKRHREQNKCGLKKEESILKIES